MAKGVKKSYDDRIAAYDEKIEKLISEKNKIIEEQEQIRKDEILKIIVRSNLTIDEVRELIENNKK